MIRPAVTPHYQDEEAYIAETEFFTQFDQSQGFSEVAAKLTASSEAGMEEAQRNLSAFYNERVTKRTSQIIAFGGTDLSTQDRQTLETAVFHALVPEVLQKHVQRPVSQEANKPNPTSTDWQLIRDRVTAANVMEPRVVEAVFSNITTLQNIKGTAARNVGDIRPLISATAGQPAPVQVQARS